MLLKCGVQPLGKIDHPDDSSSDSEGSHDNSTSSEGEDKSDSSAGGSDVPISEDGGGDAVPSGDEALDFVEEPAPEAVVPPPLDDMHDEAPLLPAAPLPEPIVLGIPAWAPGVEKADVSKSAKTQCMYCKENIPKGEVRLKFWPFASAFKSVHPKCFHRIPDALREHSVACLRYQQAFLAAGHEGVKLQDAIAAALD